MGRQPGGHLHESAVLPSGLLPNSQSPSLGNAVYRDESCFGVGSAGTSRLVGSNLFSVRASAIWQSPRIGAIGRRESFKRITITKTRLAGLCWIGWPWKIWRNGRESTLEEGRSSHERSDRRYGSKAAGPGVASLYHAVRRFSGIRITFGRSLRTSLKWCRFDHQPGSSNLSYAPLRHAV